MQVNDATSAASDTLGGQRRRSRGRWFGIVVATCLVAALTTSVADASPTFDNLIPDRVLAAETAPDGSLAVLSVSPSDAGGRLYLTTVSTELEVLRRSGAVTGQSSEALGADLAFDTASSSWLVLTSSPWSFSPPMLHSVRDGVWQSTVLPDDGAGEDRIARFSHHVDPSHLVVSQSRQVWVGENQLEQEQDHWFLELAGTDVVGTPRIGLLGDGTADPMRFTASTRLDDGQHLALVSSWYGQSEIRRYDAAFTRYELVGLGYFDERATLRSTADGHVVVSENGIAELDENGSVRRNLFAVPHSSWRPVLGDLPRVAEATFSTLPWASVSNPLDPDDPARDFALSVAADQVPYAELAAAAMVGDDLVLVANDATLFVASPMPRTTATVPATDPVPSIVPTLNRPTWTTGSTARMELGNYAWSRRYGDDVIHIEQAPTLALRADCTFEPGGYVRTSADGDVLQPFFGASGAAGDIHAVGSWNSLGVLSTSTASIPARFTREGPQIAASTDPLRPTVASAWATGGDVRVDIHHQDGSFVGTAAILLDDADYWETAPVLTIDQARHRYVVAAAGVVGFVDGSTGELIATVDLSSEAPINEPAVAIAVDPVSGIAAVVSPTEIVLVSVDGVESRSARQYDWQRGNVVADPDNGRFLLLTNTGASSTLFDVPVDGSPGSELLRADVDPFDAAEWSTLLYDASTQQGVIATPGSTLTLTPFGGGSPSCDTTLPDSGFTTRVMTPLPTSTGSFVDLTPPPTPTGDGYWLLSSSGQVVAFGGAADLGGFDTAYGEYFIDLASTPDGTGLWGLTGSGRVYTVGAADHHGHLAPDQCCAIAISATPSGEGYWIFGSDGQVWAYGDATHHGDASGLPLVGLIVDAAVTSSGDGYILLGEDGGIFTFGDADFRGSVPGVLGGQWVPTSALTLTSDGGYWIVGYDGGVFSFDAPFRGSVPGVLPPGTPLRGAIIDVITYGDGYVMLGQDGGVFTFSDRAFEGSLGTGGFYDIVDAEPYDHG